MKERVWWERNQANTIQLKSKGISSTQVTQLEFPEGRAEILKEIWKANKESGETTLKTFGFGSILYNGVW